MYRTVTPNELDIQIYDSWEEFSKLILINLEATTLGDLFKSSNVDAKVIALAENMLKRIFALPNVFLSDFSSSHKLDISKVVCGIDTVTEAEQDDLIRQFRLTDSLGNGVVNLVKLDAYAIDRLNVIKLNFFVYCHYTDEYYGEKLLKKLDRLTAIDDILSNL